MTFPYFAPTYFPRPFWGQSGEVLMTLAEAVLLLRQLVTTLRQPGAYRPNVREKRQIATAIETVLQDKGEIRT